MKLKNKSFALLCIAITTWIVKHTCDVNCNERCE